MNPLVEQRMRCVARWAFRRFGHARSHGSSLERTILTPHRREPLGVIAPGPQSRHRRTAILWCHQRAKQRGLVDRLDPKVRQVASRHHDPGVSATSRSSMMTYHDQLVSAVTPLRREHPDFGSGGEVLDTASDVHASDAVRRLGSDVRHDAEPQQLLVRNVVSVGVCHSPMIEEGHGICRLIRRRMRCGLTCWTA
jgi:hypothetical protein